MLVGRGREFAALSALLGADRPVALSGEAGIGKTALLDAALGESRTVLRGGGLATLSWMEYAPLARALAVRRLTGDSAAVADRVRAAVGTDGLLALDDLHWADEGTLQVVELLAASVPLAVTFRIGDPATEAVRSRLEPLGFAFVQLEPLDPEDAAALVRQARPDVTAVSLARVVRRCGGVPLLLTQLAGPEGEEAESLRLALASRLRGVSPAAGELFGLLSLVGRPVAIGADAPPERVTELESAGLVRRHAQGAEVVHAILADMAVSRLSDERRRELHRGAAELVTDPGERARHLEAAGDTDAARELALEAATAAASVAGQATEVAAHLAVAARCASGGEADTLRLRAAAALVEALRHADAVAILDQIVSADPVVQAEAAILRSRAAWYLGDDDGFRSALDAAVAHSEAAGPGVRARALVERSRLAIFLDPDMTPDGVTMASEALDAARAAGIPTARAEMLLGLAHYMTDRPEWQPILHAALERARAEGDGDTELVAANNLVTAHESSGDPSVGRRLAAEMIERTGAAGKVAWQLQFRAMLLNLDLHAGDCLSVVQQAVELLDEPLDRRARAQVTQSLLLALIDLGRLDVASSRLDQIEGDEERALIGSDALRWLRAEAELHGGRSRRARDLAREAVELGFADPFAPLVELWASVDLNEAPEPLDDNPAPMFAGVRSESLGAAALVRGELADAIEHLDAAATRWRPYHRRGEWRCLWAAGEAARRAGDTSDAERRLTELEAVLEERQLEPLLARVRRSLRALGVRRVTRSRRMPGGLTAREHEVMSLVAGGLSNVEIGRRLGISRSTVTEMVARSVDLLGATSRGQAAALLS